MTFRVKTIDDWQNGGGQHWDFETLDGAEHHAVAASLVRDTDFGVALIDGDTFVKETSFAVGGVLFGVSRLNDSEVHHD